MKEQSNRSEFTIGLDLGERRHRFCALNGKGEVSEEGTRDNDRASLARLTARYRGALAVMEAGAQSADLQGKTPRPATPKAFARMPAATGVVLHIGSQPLEGPQFG